MSEQVELYLKCLRAEYPPILFNKSILTVGRSESCDIHINSPYLSFIHSSVFVRDGKYYVSDLNSTNGTYVNETKVTTQELKKGDFVRFGAIRYQLVSIFDSQAQAPVSADHDQRAVSETTTLLRNTTVIAKMTEGIQEKTTVRNDDVPSIPVPEVYQEPISLNQLFPEFEFSEFIFEENIKGKAFDYSNRVPALEVTTLVENYIIGLDYYPRDLKQITISSEQTNTADHVFFPLLDTKQNFAAYNGSEWVISEVPLFDAVVISKSGVVRNPFKVEETYHLADNEVMVLKKDRFQVILKPMDSPPRILPAGFFDRDKLFMQLISIALFLAILISSIIINLVIVPEKKEEDIAKIDRILFKKERIVEKPPRPTPEIADKKQAPTAEIPKPQKTESPDEVKKNEKTDTAAGAKEKLPKADVAKQQDTKKSDNNVVVKSNQETKPKPTNDKIVAVNTPKPTQETVNKPQSDTIAKEKVTVSETAVKEVPPLLDVKSLKDKFGKVLDTVNTNRVGQFKENADSSANNNIAGSTLNSGSKNVGFAKSSGSVNADVVAGSKIGNLGDGQRISGSLGGVQGFSDGEGRTVLLGSLDPKDVQNVLKQYIPKFAFCYERELERIGKELATTLVLNFTITSAGRAADYSFVSENMTFSSQAIRCYAEVLASIQFPRPKGGGIVKIRQPMNMEPKY